MGKDDGLLFIANTILLKFKNHIKKKHWSLFYIHGRFNRFFGFVSLSSNFSMALVKTLSHMSNFVWSIVWLSWWERRLRACVVPNVSGSIPKMTLNFYQHNSPEDGSVFSLILSFCSPHVGPWPMGRVECVKKTYHLLAIQKLLECHN